MAPSLTIGLFVPSQLVRGELERLQPDVRWRHAEPSGPVRTASPLPIREGLSQPVPAARPLQPPGLPLPELPAHLERWALGRGNLGRVGMWGGSWAPPVEHGWAWDLQQGLIRSLLGANAYCPYAVLTNLREGVEEEVRGLQERQPLCQGPAAARRPLQLSAQAQDSRSLSA